MKYIVLLGLAALSSANAAISISLPGNSESAEWAALNNINYPGAGGSSSFFNPTAAWPAPIPGNGTPTSGAVFSKVSGGGYFASSSVYDAGVAGTFSLSDASPISDLATVVFQADVGAVISVAPVLNYNGGSQALLADFNTTSTGLYTLSSPGGPVPSTNNAWQWDLTGVVGPITSYEIVWGSVINDHLTQIQLNIDAGDSFVQVIPEPSSLVFAPLAALALLRRRRA